MNKEKFFKKLDSVVEDVRVSERYPDICIPTTLKLLYSLGNRSLLLRLFNEVVWEVAKALNCDPDDIKEDLSIKMNSYFYKKVDKLRWLDCMLREYYRASRSLDKLLTPRQIALGEVMKECHIFREMCERYLRAKDLVECATQLLCSAFELYMLED